MENWIKIVITVLIVVALVPTIASALASLNGNENISAGALAIFGLTIVVLAGGFIFMIYRSAVGGGKKL